ncbi:MAG: MlaD family protein [Pseudomonadota bacterium]
MATRGQALKLGIFLIGSLVALALLLGAFAGFEDFWRRTERYYVLVPGSVEGLEVGSTVKIRGVRVGRVGALELHPGGFAGVRVALDVPQDTRIPRDAKAFLRFQGLTGLKLVDIDEGSPEAGPLPPGGYIEYGETPIDALTARAGDIVEQVTHLLASTDALMTRLAATAEELELERLNTILRRADGALDHLEQASEQLALTLRETRAPLRETVARTDEALVRAAEVLENVNETVENLGEASNDVRALIQGSDQELRTTVYNLREASQSFKELGRELRLNPSRLLFSRPPRERELP